MKILQNTGVDDSVCTHACQSYNLMIDGLYHKLSYTSSTHIRTLQIFEKTASSLLI